MYTSYLSLIFSGILLNVAAQLALKYGLGKIGYFELKLSNLYIIGPKLLTNPYIFSGLSCYALSVVFWIIALSRVEISYAYPLTSLGYVLTALAGFFLFQEDLSFMRILGIIIILIGVFFVSRS